MPAPRHTNLSNRTSVPLFIALHEGVCPCGIARPGTITEAGQPTTRPDAISQQRRGDILLSTLRGLRPSTLRPPLTTLTPTKVVTPDVGADCIFYALTTLSDFPPLFAETLSLSILIDSLKVRWSGWSGWSDVGRDYIVDDHPTMAQGGRRVVRVVKRGGVYFSTSR
jgi:hypothetical protein